MHNRNPIGAVISVTPPLMSELLARVLTDLDLEVCRYPECLNGGRTVDDCCDMELAVVSGALPPGLRPEVVIRVMNGEETPAPCSRASEDGARVFEMSGLDEVLALVRSLVRG